MTLNLLDIPIDRLRSNPWRFSENMAEHHEESREYTRIFGNIVQSLHEFGQLAPIHVRSSLPIADGYQILDGHQVVDAARYCGIPTLQAIPHDVNDEQARLLYIHFNLNRGGQYGHYHVKIHRVFGQVQNAKDVLQKHTSWPVGRIESYVDLDESHDNWHRFMFIPKQEEGAAIPGMDAVNEDVADCQ